MRNRHSRRVYLLLIFFFLGMAGIMMRLSCTSQQSEAAQAGARQGKYHLQLSLSDGVIYDRFFRPLNQSETTLLAAVSPMPDTGAVLFSKVKDYSGVSDLIRKGAPFVCDLKEPVESSANMIVFEGKCEQNGIQPAQHLIGYKQFVKGATGLEAAFDSLLRSYDSVANVTFSVNAHGEALPGYSPSFQVNQDAGGGIVTTLDCDIQRIVETALQSVLPNGGAAVVTECQYGDIMACASVPVYNPKSLSDSLHDPALPFLNRALCAYNVGSVFKLAVAAAAIEYGIGTEYYCECDGAIDVYGQHFNCHKRSGHGIMNLQSAMTVSCNPYFISLTEMLSVIDLHQTACFLGFGQKLQLAEGMFADAGNLQSVEELKVPAEKANFSFGQGKLLATPLHIAAMTGCIANGGIWTLPRLIDGETPDGKTLIHQQEPCTRRAIRPETAAKLQEMMKAVLTNAEHSNGIPHNVSAAGKTSTAQTGHFSIDGTEYCHAWMTGFFPAEHPKYTVTVFVENGGSGNEAAAPVFRRIIEEMTRAGL